MDHIIKDLDSNLLQQWGFEFDGANWTHKNYPFSLTSTNDGYLPVLKDGSSDLHPIKSATALLQLIVRVAPYYLQLHSDTQLLNKEAELQRLANLLQDYFKFDPNLKFGMHLDPSGNGALGPANAYTLTLLNGSEATFKVTHGTKSKIVEDIVYLHPTAMGYPVLKKMFNDEIISVKIECSNGEWEPFFGVGIE